MGDGRSVWIGNIPNGTTEAHIERLFSEYGALAGPVSLYPNSTRDNMQYGFVDFVSTSSVTGLLNENPEIWIDDCVLRIRPSTSKKRPSSAYYTSKSEQRTRHMSSDSRKSSQNDITSIWVENLPPDAKNWDVCHLFSKFGKLDKPGCSIFSRPNGTTCDAFVNFIHEESVTNVLNEKSSLHLRDYTLNVSSLDHRIKCYFLLDNNEPYYLIKASYLPSNVSRRDVFNVFKEPPFLSLIQDTNEAYIPYASLVDAENATKHKDVKIRGTLVDIESVYQISESTQEALRVISPHVQNNLNNDYSSDKDKLIVHTPLPSVSTSLTKNPSNCSVQIRNVNGLSSDKILLQYFKNEQRSKGGKVVDYTFEKMYDRAVVIFENAEVAENVLNKANGHVLENKTLYVSKLPPISSNTIYLENVPENLLKIRHFLELYVEVAARCDVKVTLSERSNGALVCFQEQKNIDEFEEKFFSRLFKDDILHDDDELKVLTVLSPDGILVHGKIPSEDSLMLALEEFLRENFPDVNPTVRYIMYQPKLETSLVVFDDYRAIECLKDSIIVDDEIFRINTFYDYLGWIKYL